MLDDLEREELRRQWRIRDVDPSGTDRVRWCASAVMACAILALPWLPALLALAGAWPLARADIRGGPASTWMLRKATMRDLRASLRWACVLAIAWPLWLSLFSADDRLWLRLLLPAGEAAKANAVAMEGTWWPVLLWPLVAWQATLGEPRADQTRQRIHARFLRTNIGGPSNRGGLLCPHTTGFTLDMYDPLNAQNLGDISRVPILLCIYWSAVCVVLANALLILDSVIGHVATGAATSAWPRRRSSTDFGGRSSMASMRRCCRSSSPSWRSAALRTAGGGVAAALTTLLPVWIGIAGTLYSHYHFEAGAAESLYGYVVPILAVCFVALLISVTTVTFLTRSALTSTWLYEQSLDGDGCGATAVEEHEGGSLLRSTPCTAVDGAKPAASGGSVEQQEEAINKYICKAELVRAADMSTPRQCGCHAPCATCHVSVRHCQGPDLPLLRACVVAWWPLQVVGQPSEAVVGIFPFIQVVGRDATKSALARPLCPRSADLRGPL